MQVALARCLPWRGESPDHRRKANLLVRPRRIERSFGLPQHRLQAGEALRIVTAARFHPPPRSGPRMRYSLLPSDGAAMHFADEPPLVLALHQYTVR